MIGSALPYIAFAGFGMFWGTWGASLPGLRAAGGLTDAQLGAALLCVGIGAVPAMALTGRAVDRFGSRAGGLALVALALTGVALALFGRDLAALAVGMLLVGATSGSADVAANALAGSAERATGRRVITRAHAVFSCFVVVGSLITGALTAATSGLVPTFVVSGILIAAAGGLVFLAGASPRSPRRHHPAKAPRTVPPRTVLPRTVPPLLPLVAIGLVGALGFASENAHQSWSAIFLTDELQATPLVASFAPATFALFAAAARFSVGFSTRIPDSLILRGGALTAVLGALLLAVAPNVPVAVTGLAIAAIGTSVLFPTLLSRATRHVDDDTRGRATSVVATTAYLGFVLGPVYVGFLSGALGLRGAIIGVAALCLAFALLAPIVTRRRTERLPPHPLQIPRPDGLDRSGVGH
ncbi:MFS transporter [Herbiconiux sp. P15]|uniref:MFS transporter n=1 Tax=Herbiconiux liukaitaii TaxID=3342799 RepID=UPI0035BA76BB